jgi:hypothetical protein
LLKVQVVHLDNNAINFVIKIVPEESSGIYEGQHFVEVFEAFNPAIDGKPQTGEPSERFPMAGQRWASDYLANLVDPKGEVARLRDSRILLAKRSRGSVPRVGEGRVTNLGTG